MDTPTELDGQEDGQTQWFQYTPLPDMGSGGGGEVINKNWLHQLLKNAACSHFLQMDGRASLPFMQLINLYIWRDFRNSAA